MSSPDDAQFPQHGLLPPSEEDNPDQMTDLVQPQTLPVCHHKPDMHRFANHSPNVQAHLVLDDIMYNILHDIVLKAHREEKLARASTAAILIEATAEESNPNNPEEPTAIEHRVENEAAIYKNGEVYIKGNPLKTISHNHCPKCGKPRLLHPTDGNRARKVDPTVNYCKKHPWIEKDYHDVYGQVYQPDGPGRGKKKKDMVNPILEAVKANGSVNGDSPGGSPPSEIPVPKLLNFPTGKCVGCGNAIMIKRLNGHMAKCMGGGGRESSRNANLKLQNGGSGNGTPPGSRTGTPAPSNTSSNKRDRDDDFDSDSSPQKKMKKSSKDGLKKSAMPKKLKDLKAPKMAKSSSQQASNLSFEERAPGMSDSDDDGDDDKDGDFGGSVSVEPKKKIKLSINPHGKKMMKDKKKWSLGNGKPKPPDDGYEKPIKSDLSKDVVGDSESSQTLSSPN